jgi:hypothetical protein
MQLQKAYYQKGLDHYCLKNEKLFKGASEKLNSFG